MIDQTESFKKLKVEQQRILDFTVLICYSVPSLKKTIKGYNEKVKNYENLATPDYFKLEDNSVERLDRLAKDYKPNLSKYTLLSAFSFFESYFRDSIQELIAFHGGKELFVSIAHERHKDFLKNQSQSIVASKRFLNRPYKKRKWQQYKKHLNVLDNEPKFRYPSELLATYGLKYFIDLISGSAFRSHMIPDIMEFGFSLDLSDKINKHPELKEKTIRETFDTMRDLRNSIGHGSTNDIGLEKTMDLIRFLRHLAVKFDNHLVKNYFLVERAK